MNIISLSALRALEHRTTNPTYAIRIFDWHISNDNPKNQPLVLPAQSIVVPYQFEEHNMDFYNRPDVREHYGDEQIDKMQERSFTEDIAREIISDFIKDREGRLELLVHCNAGLNRSPSVAQALNDLFSLSDAYKNERVRKFFVYKTMMKVGLSII